ncbi:hypothetical protein FUAX_48890 (plasmid) [Fulvitalea axinellae]|uniref:DUF985 domain-containing protein n=1 Tax=Fulvitalea axinellae TaxID=1182444 RepID=A0AAU9D4S1_9BACT|nr:hypothetical protein FUAX_48890 [Fulvitalea axinellae]
MESEKIKKIVSALELEAHPEGGYFKETYRSEGKVKREALPEGFNGDRNFCTAIYFLLTKDNFSAFHRICQDEIWHFYSGDPLYVHVIDQDGEYTRHEVGPDIESGQEPQLVVSAGAWFASSVKEGEEYSLVGCTVSPGFDFEDFELADREKLSEEYPEHIDIIRKLTRV